MRADGGGHTARLTKRDSGYEFPGEMKKCMYAGADRGSFMLTLFVIPFETINNGGRAKLMSLLGKKRWMYL